MKPSLSVPRPHKHSPNDSSSSSPTLYHGHHLQLPKRRRHRRHLSAVLREEGHEISELERKQLHDVGVDTDFDISDTCPTPLRRSCQYSSTCSDIRSASLKSKTLSTPSDASSLSIIHRERRANTPKLSGLVRFKKIVHKVINGKAWMAGLNSSVAQSKAFIGPGRHRGEKEILSFNVNVFRPEKYSYNSLSLQAKVILMRPPWLRTDSELNYLSCHTLRLKCFDRYSLETRKALSKVMYYERIEKDRVVIRQGQVGMAFYFIVSGSVLVETEAKDELHGGRKTTLMVAELTPGASFGEWALLHNTTRGATVICNDETELLYLDRKDYDVVLRNSHKREWESRTRLIKKHPLFRGYSSESLFKAIEGSYTQEYKRDSVILKDLSIPSLRVNFIVKGHCMVVQKVKLWEKVQSYHQDNYMFPMYAESSTKTSSTSCSSLKLVGNKVYRLVIKWWLIRILKEGEYFGLGEGNENMCVICDQSVTILMMSRMVFHHHNRGQDLIRLLAEATSWYPSSEEALKSYIEWKRWMQYKRNVGLEILGMKHENESIENYNYAL